MAKMKMADVFDVEVTIMQGCKTKHWQLIKLLNKNLAKCREHTDVARKALEQSPATKAYFEEQERVKTENSGETAEVQSARIRELKTKHEKGLEELFALRKLETEIMADSVEVEWVPIQESLLHDGGTLRIEPEAYMSLTRHGIVQE